jgi:hypothetical protein
MPDILGCILVGLKHWYALLSPMYCEYQACGNISWLDIICDECWVLACFVLPIVGLLFIPFA